ncbi:hypothetical protein FHS77_000805 [Paenochrobactrum gallinarii]|uniref:Porin n=1 Tax=Paenochrobactrum gallinarii TaxID=643673 RepID=A0A841M1N5_9HYPH|nr:porin [Paenochrobactrum gallinarii]MBB6260281.1 hypothetical protein [Paenochrobactrum gallinarii]
MNIKSLLLGSAAALVAATGANAADAIIAPEPEAVEYVRVCDAYGAGFFYIPGTETCLRVSGMVRYQIDWTSEDDGWKKYGRAELNFDARNETELGTLRSFIKLRATSHSGHIGDTAVSISGTDFNKLKGKAYGNNGNVGLQEAFIGLGGLEMGLRDTLYDAGLSGEFDSGGGSRVHFMSYTFAGGNGFSATLALEEADYDYDYKPNVVGKLGFTQGWGSVDAWVAYDATAKEWAVKGIAKANVTDAVWLEAIATYESGHNFYGVITAKDFGFGSVSANLGAKWSLGGLVGYKFNDKLKASIGAQYFDKIAHVSGLKGVSAGATVDYEVVKGFNTKLAVNYLSAKYQGQKEDGWAGFVRFQRNF